MYRRLLYGRIVHSNGHCFRFQTVFPNVFGGGYSVSTSFRFHSMFYQLTNKTSSHHQSSSALQIFIPYMIAKRKAKKSSVGDQDDMNDSSDSVLEKKYRALSKNTRGKHPQFMKDYDLSNYDPNSSLNDQYAYVLLFFFLGNPIHTRPNTSHTFKNTTAKWFVNSVSSVYSLVVSH